MPLDHLWPPPIATAPTAPTAPRSRRVRRAAVTTIAAGVIGAAIGIDRPVNSVGTAIVLLAIAAAAVRSGMLADRSRTTMVCAALVFVPWLTFRASPWLLVPDLIAAAVLGVIATSSRNGARLADSAVGYGRRAGIALGGALGAPRRAILGVQAEVAVGPRRLLRQNAGPAALGLALACLVAAVLASGDALFASFFEIGDVVSTAVGRFVAASIVMSAVVATSGAAAASEDRPPIPSRAWASPRSTIVAAVPLVLVYIAFVAVQISTLVLGADYVRNRTGLTFAEYARSGFFQLVAVGFITFLGLLVLRPVVRRADSRERRVLRGLAVVASICTVAMVVAAIVKLDLYADVFGLTMLRVYTSVFAAWLGLVLVLALWSQFRLDGEWVVPAVAVTALVGVFGMNVVNPERVVADHNLTETITSDEFDIGYLLDLSADAVPAISAHLDDLPSADRAIAIDRLCTRAARSGWLDWNASVDRASTTRTDC